MDRGNHYEAAFEGYLRARGLCFVGVEEARQAQWGDVRLKNLDFIVHGDGGIRLLVDIKGRRFPTSSQGRPRFVWESWATLEDIHSLRQWLELFGPGYRGLLVFAYQLAPAIALLDDPHDDIWLWHRRKYLYRAVDVTIYRQHMRPRSPRWGTVSLPGQLFRELARPFCHFTRGPKIIEPSVR
ncbi:MAG: HYExAFE family protein [Gemmataceae bacterium]